MFQFRPAMDLPAIAFTAGAAAVGIVAGALVARALQGRDRAPTGKPPQVGKGKRRLVVAMVGGGCVGGGVAEMLRRLGDQHRIELRYVVVRDLAKARDFRLPAETTMVDDWRRCIADDEVDVVVEVMGGTSVAREVTFAAIEAGKHVVSANKTLLAECLPAIEAALVRRPTQRVCFEAAVAGGIPIVHSLRRSLLACEISTISGILNGTTNYILSKMEKEGVELAPSLQEAQRLGFAEADPTSDVDGFDAQQKLVLLIRMAFHLQVEAAHIHAVGIRRVSADDFAILGRLGLTVRLVARAGLSGGAVNAFVSPCVVQIRGEIGSTVGPGNVVHISSSEEGSYSLKGPGAGRFPTASAIVADVLALRHDESLPSFTQQTRALVERLSELQEVATIKKAVDVDRDPEQFWYIRCTGPSAETCIALLDAELSEQRKLFGPAETATATKSAYTLSSLAVPRSAAESLVRALLRHSNVHSAVAFPVLQ